MKKVLSVHLYLVKGFFMLTAKQRNKLNTMVTNYEYGVMKTIRKPRSLIEVWVTRYRIIMEQVLQRQGKR